MRTKLLYVAAIAACVLALIPPLWALFISFSEPSNQGWRVSLANYREVLDQPQFWTSLLHSFLAAGFATVVSLLLGTMAAYGMTRFGGRYNWLAMLVLAIRMVPSIVLVIPFYLLFRDLGLLDCALGLAVTYLTFSVPFAIWMIRGFLVAIPFEIDEAARLDGANAWTVLWRIIVPIAMPPLLTTGVLIFSFCWNEFLFALVLTDQHALTFLPMLMRFVPPQGPLYGQIFAGSTIYFTVPIVALAFIRRQLEGSFTAGSVK